MTESTPPTGPEPDAAEHTAALPDVSYEETPTRSTGRRGLIIGAVAALVVLVLGGAAYGVFQYLDGGGARPEDALPSSTVGVISVDLDPKAGQKIEAIKTLRKFPALRKELGVESQDDLRQLVVDKAIAGECAGINYEDDVKPWIGKRAAFAGVDLGDKYPSPAIVLQVSDADKARDGFEKLAKCGDDELPSDLGYAIRGDYLVASDSKAHAEKILADGEKKPLTEQKAYQDRTEEIGGKGIVNLYIGPGAGQYFDEVFDALIGELGPEFGGAFESSLGQQLESRGQNGDDPMGTLEKEFDKFTGAAAALRFADGGLELVVGSNAGSTTTRKLEADAVGRTVAELPGDTALALGFSLPKGFGKSFLDGVRAGGGEEVDQFLTEAEQQTGLTLPEDLETLLGQAVTLSVGGDAPSSLEDFNDPENVPVGLVLHNDDPDAAMDVIGKVEQSLGLRLADIPIATEKADDLLAFSPSSAYAEALTKAGKLGDSALFKKAVPDADHAQSVFFLGIDKNWREAIIDLASEGLSPADSETLADNLKPFGALGFSTTLKDGVTTFQFRIATN